MASATSADAPPAFQLQRLPTELICEIIKLAFPGLFKRTVLPLAICKGRLNSMVIGPQYELIDKTHDIRMLLSLCQITRAIVLREKPNTLPFARRLNKGRTIPYQHSRAYPNTSVFVYPRECPVLYFNATQDILLLSSNYSAGLIQKDATYASLQLSLPPGFIGQDIQYLHLEAKPTLFRDDTCANKLWNSILSPCSNLKRLWVSEKAKSPAWLSLGEEAAIYANSDICDHFQKDEHRVRCYVHSPDAMEYTFDPLTDGELVVSVHENIMGYACNYAIIHVNPDNILPAYEFMTGDLPGWTGM